MGGLADSIGTIAVSIVGDYGQLLDDLVSAQDAAESSGEQIAEAFNQAGERADEATPKVEQFGEGVKETGEKAKEAEGGLSELGDKVVELATEMGLLIGAGEVIKETFGDFSRVESATVALTALDGSAEVAQEQIERLEQLATNENLSFPALLDANQRMVAFGFSAEDIPAALQAAADAAAATNTNIEATAGAIERMAASGMAGNRQLVALGLTTKDLADIMGIAEGDVKKAFAALDESTRLEVLTAAMGKFEGQAQKAAGTLKGEWQGVKNTFEGFFVTLGGFLEPAAKQILTWFDSIGKAAEVFVLAIQVNLEKLEFYFEKFTGQVDAANAKAQEINANAAKFRALVEGGGPGAAGGVTGAKTGGASDIEGLQAKIAAQLADTDAVKRLSQAQIDLNQRTQEQINFGDILKDTLADLQSEHDKYAKTVAQSGILTDYFAKQAMPSAIAAMGEAMSSTPPVVEGFKNMGIAAVNVGDILTGLEGKVKPPLDALHEALFKIDQGLASGNYAAVESIIGKLATDDLPTAVAQQERYVAALENANVSSQRLATSQQKLLELQMELAVEQDRSTASYATRLALIDLHTKNLGYDSRQAFGTLATQALNAMDAGLSRIGTSLAKTALETHNWGQMAHQLITQLAEDLLGALLNALVKMGEEFILEKLTEATTSSATAVAGVTNAAGVGYANAFAATAAIPIIGPELAPGVAAAAEAAILAGGLPLASAAGGAALSEDTVVQAHARELILPANLSEGIQDMIEGNRQPSGAAGVTISIGQVTGVMRDTVKSVAQEIVRQAKLAGAFH